MKFYPPLSIGFTHAHISPLNLFFFFNDTATTEIYTLSLHDALPILPKRPLSLSAAQHACNGGSSLGLDRKSTRLNSSHSQISYAGFCLKKKKILASRYILWDWQWVRFIRSSIAHKA